MPGATNARTGMLSYDPLVSLDVTKEMAAGHCAHAIQLFSNTLDETGTSGGMPNPFCCTALFLLLYVDMSKTG
jgi:hypothetical protein